jgi:hypothetical protein
LTEIGGDPHKSLRRAMAYGTVIASFTVEGFGLESLKRIERDHVDRRYHSYREMLAI